MTDDRDTDDVDEVSEILDGDRLGEDVGDEHRPGTVDFPPERTLGAEDPTLAGDDDVATRELRREVDTDDPSSGDGGDTPVLVDPDPVVGLDHDEQEWADDEPAVDELSAEEQAIHVLPDEPAPAGTTGSLVDEYVEDPDGAT